MMVTVLSIMLCQLPNFAPINDASQQEEIKEECDFSEYKPIRISDYKVPIKNRVEPEYPRLAVEAKITGRVIVKVLIDLKGNVIRACARNEHALLKQAAIEAALKWKFIRDCRSCLGRNTEYMEEFIVFNFELNAPTRPSNKGMHRSARSGAHMKASAARAPGDARR